MSAPAARPGAAGVPRDEAGALLRVDALQLAHEAGAPVLSGATLTLHAGERLALRGANGSGKSSLLQALMGLLPAAGGRIVLFGRDCRAERDFAPLRGRIGLLFQDSDDQLFCPTVLEDVAFGPLNQGCDAAQARASAPLQTLARLDIAALAPRAVHRLSGGEKRLAALAGLLAMRPEVLLLDEPTTGLDEAAQQRVAGLLLSLPQAMLIASHDEAFLARVATRTLVLRDGRTQEAGSPQIHQ